MGVFKDQLEWTGEENIQIYDLQAASDNHVETAFCRECGSPVYKRAVTGVPDIYFLQAGLLDKDSIASYAPQMQIWLSQQPAWDRLV